MNRRAYEKIRDDLSKLSDGEVFPLIQHLLDQRSNEEIRLVLAVIDKLESASKSEAVTVSALLAEANDIDPWRDARVLGQDGTCMACKCELFSYAKRVKCPNCGSEAYCT